MEKVRLIVVGGFLGAGKTTLLWEAAKRLAGSGRRVGLLTNDQAPDLVDTALLAGEGLSVREVHGSCFCCNFPGMIRAAEELGRDVGADILIAEPVGSCTDLSATILQPLKDKFAHEFELAPFSVLVDPFRLREVLTGKDSTLHPSAAYILRKQLEEADLIVLNKIDLLYGPELAELRGLAEERFPGSEVCCLSAQDGQGVDDWLARVAGTGEGTVLRGRRTVAPREAAPRAPGSKIAEVDYDIYAEGEAVLGWLNAAVELSAPGEAPDWRGFCRGLMESLREEFRARHAEVGHLKLILSAAQGSGLLANLTRLDGEVILRGDLPASTRQAKLVLNARVEMPPADLESLVRQNLARAAGEIVGVNVVHMRSLSPGRPRPTHRYDRVV
jgi:Ni2+-binding GTPase involved in maturation of urease and hydrogenase